nr:ATP-binding cassette domain-containing protein [Pseudonocardia sp. ICBG601]
MRDRLAGPVDLVLDGGDRLLVTGPNGAGKSTLLAVLAGALDPDTGAVRTARGARVVLLGQETAVLDPRWPARAVLEQAGGGAHGLLDAAALRTPVGRLSEGQRRRLDLAVTLAARPTTLLLDEPTNHLSARLVDELTAMVLDTSAAVVVATHDRQLLRDLADWPRLELGTAG